MQGKTMTIDFVSTRNGVDVQSQRCAKLIASIIAQALTDLTVKPTSKERIGKININADAVRSIRFFQSDTFFQYAALVGFDGKEFLDRITVGGTTTEYNGKEWVTKLRVIPKNYISEMGLRTIRARMRWRCSEHTPLLPTSEEDVADEIAWDLEEAQLKEKNLRALEKLDAKRKNNNRESSQHAVDIDRVHRVSKIGRNKVDTQVSTTKRGNAKILGA
jgi:hypothetical protein